MGNVLNKLCKNHQSNKKLHNWLLISLLITSGCQNDEPPKTLESTSTLPIAVKPPLQNEIVNTETHNSFNYNEHVSRNPFMPFKQLETLNQINTKYTTKTPAPNTKRHKEVLESYPINSLKMLGHIEYKNEIWALIKTDDFLIHRVKVGNYIGVNYGKITAITSHMINISESLLDQKGLWHEQLTFINLKQ